MQNEAIYKDCITKPFLNYNNEKVTKHLQFSTRLFRFSHEKYIVMIVEDITELINLKSKEVLTIIHD